MADWFSRFASRTAYLSGHYLAFIIMTLICVVWAFSGPIFGFSDTWQLVINTATTVLTFLMVFLIQNTQNRDSTATHVKLDEIIRSLDNAENIYLAAETKSDKELAKDIGRYHEMAKE